MSEKYYIAEKDSRLKEDYEKYCEFAKQMSDIFDEFAKENGIEAKAFHPNVERLWFVPTDKDCFEFGEYFVKNQPGKFKSNSELNKKWVETCRNNRMTENLIYPFIPFYFSGAIGACRTRLFDIDGVVYCSLENELDFKPNDKLIEIKASEFYTAIESINNKGKE